MTKIREKGASQTCCPPKPKISDRRLIKGKQAAELEGLFKVLSNATRLKLLHALIRAGELCVTDLAKAAGMKPQAVSNQLQRLAARSIVATRREGNNIYYHIVDPCVVSLIDQGLCLIEDAKGRMG